MRVGISQREYLDFSRLRRALIHAVDDLFEQAHVIDWTADDERVHARVRSNQHGFFKRRSHQLLAFSRAGDELEDRLRIWTLFAQRDRFRVQRLVQNRGQHLGFGET